MRDTFVEDRLPPPEVLPEFRFDLPELQYPERLNAAAELLKGGAPDALAVINEHGRWTYAQLDDFSGRIARLMVDEHGLIPGNRVLLRGPNTYTMFAAWLGVLKVGGVVVATMPLLRPGRTEKCVGRSAPDPPLLHLRRRASPGSHLAGVEGPNGDRDHRRHRLDRDDAHLRLSRGR